MSHEENPEVAKPNPYKEHVTRVNEVYLKLYQLGNEGFFITIAEGDTWEAKRWQRPTRWKTSRFEHGFHFGIGSGCTQQSGHEHGYDFQLQCLFPFCLYVQATLGIVYNSIKPRTFSAITLMPKGSGNGSVRIMNLNTGKVRTRKPSQITQLPMPHEWLDILVLWANVSGKLRSAETHCEHRGHELPEQNPANVDSDPTRIVNL
jgi:hypothetical protein